MSIDDAIAVAVASAVASELRRQLPALVRDAVREAMAAKTPEPFQPLRKILNCSAGAARARLHRIRHAGLDLEGDLGGVLIGREWHFRASDVAKWGSVR